MYLEKLDFQLLKDMSSRLSDVTYKDAEGDEIKFYKGKKLKTIAVSKEDLAKSFYNAVQTIDEEVVNNLPQDVIDFYNDYISDAAGPAPEGEAGAAAAPEAKAEEAAPKPEAKPEKAPKEKKEAPVKEKKEKPVKEKAVVELSVFGHKLGSQAAALDDLLKDGNPISLEELSKKSGRSSLGVKSHINHLQTSRGLTIEEKEGVYKLVKK